MKHHEEFVVVYRSDDPLEAQMYEEILVANDINARLIGTLYKELWGAPFAPCPQKIEVPKTQEKEALALLEEIRAAPPLDDQHAIFETELPADDPTGDGAAIQKEDENIDDDDEYFQPHRCKRSDQKATSSWSRDAVKKYDHTADALLELETKVRCQ